MVGWGICWGRSNYGGAVYEGGFGCCVPDDGFIFRFGPSGSATLTFPLLQPANRIHPQGGLAIDAHGNVYGATMPNSGGGVGSAFEVIF